MKLRIEKVTKKSKDIKKIKEIFKVSFSKEERMPFFMMLLMQNMDNINFLSFYDEDKLCGFTYMANYNGITFLIYLAVDKQLRSKGYGSAILNEIQLLHPENKIILYIDRCDIEATDKQNRLKRKSFYLKNGYEETGYLTQSTKEYQEILIKNGKFEKEEFFEIVKKSSNGMLKTNIIEKN